MRYLAIFVMSVCWLLLCRNEAVGNLLTRNTNSVGVMVPFIILTSLSVVNLVICLIVLAARLTGNYPNELDH